MSVMDVLNGVASVLTIVGFVLACAERIARRRERNKDGRH